MRFYRISVHVHVTLVYNMEKSWPATNTSSSSSTASVHMRQKWVYNMVFSVRLPRRGPTPVRRVRVCARVYNHNSDYCCCGTASWPAFCTMPFRDMKYISNRFLHPRGLHKLCDVCSTHVHVYTHKKRRAFAVYFFGRRLAAVCVDIQRGENTKKPNKKLKRLPVMLGKKNPV